jgi:uncharacterized membrane-anchored protein
MKKKRNKKRVIQPVKRKPKIWAILVGIIVIIVSCVVGNSINDHRLVRMNGILINAPITEISYGIKGGRSGTVKVEGKLLSIYKLSDNYAIGDSISVRYDKEKSLVVQEKYNNNYFTVYFLLDSLLLILGILMLYGGIAGKDFSQ